jgi:DNA-binding IclR family transcriptional regulator
MNEPSLSDVDGLRLQVLNLLAEHGRPVLPLQLAVELGVRDAQCRDALQKLVERGLVRAAGRQFEPTPTGLRHASQYGVRPFARTAHDAELQPVDLTVDDGSDDEVALPLF